MARRKPIVIKRPKTATRSGKNRRTSTSKPTLTQQLTAIWLRASQATVVVAHRLRPHLTFTAQKAAQAWQAAAKFASTASYITAKASAMAAKTATQVIVKNALPVLAHRPIVITPIRIKLPASIWDLPVPLPCYTWTRPELPTLPAVIIPLPTTFGRLSLPQLSWPTINLPQPRWTPPAKTAAIKKTATVKIRGQQGVIFSAHPLPFWHNWGQSLANFGNIVRRAWIEFTQEWHEISGLTASKTLPKTPAHTTPTVTKPTRQPRLWQKRLSQWWRRRLVIFKRRRQQLGRGIQKLGRALTRPFVVVVRRYPWPLGILTFVLVSSLGTGYFVYVFVFKDLPAVTQLTEQQPPVTTKILDRNGTTLFGIYKDENRTVIPLSEVPTHLIHATVAIEDKEFYQHHGFSVRGIARAALANAKGEIVQGGSTITQQLVKNRLLSPEQTLQRKLKEVVLAIQADSTFTKDEVLEMYLNEVAYGGSTYGIEEAAQQYFGKSARDLSLAESALLAGLPAAPSAYSPFGPSPELAYARQEEVLRRMYEDGYITLEEGTAAKQEVLQFRANRVDIKAPHFVMYVKRLLAEQFGEELLNEGGLEVTTTLDLPLHDQAQKIVTDEITKLQRLRITNGAALITNPKTGEVLSMVGSTDYFDFEHDGQVNVTLRQRQPGSSIKPLTYAAAFERGKSPSSVEDDAPVVYNLPGSKPYAPKNYDGRFHGRVTLRESLGSSYNIPAVKLLAWVGLDAVIDKGREMGLTTWEDRRRFGLSLTLGGGEVMMIDMAKLYGTFANQGNTVDLNPILEVKNYKGEVLYRNQCVYDNICPKRKTLDSRVAYYVTDILKDNQARTPAFGPRSVLTIPGQEVAVKTGTTNNLRDNWTIGYTSDRVVAVWVGNNDSTPMSYVASGITGASPIWNNIIRLTLNDASPHVFAGPEGMVKVQICARTGTLPCKGCPYIKDEYFVPGTEPKLACSPAQFAPKPKASPTPNPDQILDGLFSP